MLGAFLLACAAVGLLWFLGTPYRTGLWFIPGPLLRKYTNIPEVIDAYQGRTCQIIKKLHDQYGPIVAIGPRTVIFSDPAMIDTVYATRNPFPKSHHWAPFRTELKGVHYPTLLASEETATHSALKRPIAGVFAMSNVIKSEGFVNEEILLLVKELISEHSDTNTPLSVFSWMHYFAFDTIMKLTISNDFGLIKGTADRVGMFKGADAAQTYRAMSSCMPWVHEFLKGSPITKVFERRMGSFPARARELIQARRSKSVEKTADGQIDLLSQILDTRNNHPEIVDERVVHGYVITPLLAGGDGVTVGLTSVIYYVSKHSHVAIRLREELDNSGLSIPPSWAAVQKLPYLDAVIREAFRCHPIGAMLSRRAVPTGATVVLDHGRRLLPGTAVAVSGYATHFNPDIYGNDVLDFRPERWLQGPSETDDNYAERLRKMNKADLTWGHGDRACVGKHIARCEMYKLIATLYSIFEIRLVDQAKDWVIKETVLAKQADVDAVLSVRPNGLSLLKQANAALNGVNAEA